jgi:dynein heavy chain
LDSKRRAFPRFYFVSVSDLLDILSNGNAPAKINRHMSKIFQAVETLTLTDGGADRPTAENMKTGVGSEDPVKFSQPLKLLGKVEVYMQDVVDMMVRTLRDIAAASFKAKVSPNMERRKWLERDPAQITLLVNNIVWSSEV